MHKFPGFLRLTIFLDSVISFLLLVLAWYSLLHDPVWWPYFHLSSFVWFPKFFMFSIVSFWLYFRDSIFFFYILNYFYYSAVCFYDSHSGICSHCPWVPWIYNCYFKSFFFVPSMLLFSENSMLQVLISRGNVTLFIYTCIFAVGPWHLELGLW